MRNYKGLLLCIVLCASTYSAQATAVLFEFGMNVDGISYCADPVLCDFSGLSDLSTVPGLDQSGFDYASGLGTLSLAVDEPGTHSVILYLDHEFDTLVNTYFNESGATTGTPEAGQSWEIDEPGFVFGDIFFNMLDGTLDNSNAIPPGRQDDVAMALGWDFALDVGETALLLFDVSVAPKAAFSLSHIDPDSGASIHFSSVLTNPSTPVDEPPAFALLIAGLLALAQGLVPKRTSLSRSFS